MTLSLALRSPASTPSDEACAGPLDEQEGHEYYLPSIPIDALMFLNPGFRGECGSRLMWGVQYLNLSPIS